MYSACDMINFLLLLFPTLYLACTPCSPKDEQPPPENFRAANFSSSAAIKNMSFIAPVLMFFYPFLLFFSITSSPRSSFEFCPRRVSYVPYHTRQKVSFSSASSGFVMEMRFVFCELWTYFLLFFLSLSSSCLLVLGVDGYSCNWPLSMTRPHTHTHTHTHTLYDSSRRVISPTQRPLPNNTEQSQETATHGPGEIRTRNPSKRHGRR